LPGLDTADAPPTPPSQMLMICIFQGSWGRIWLVMMWNKQDTANTPPKKNNLNGNDMYLSGVMGKNLACNDEEQSGYPPTPPQLNGNDMYLSGVMGEDGNLIVIQVICCSIS